jgi:glycosyltransferase involved in cell wall biosynthesis
MKILILSTFERTGGAAVAANRLMHALNKSGHEAKMLVCDKQTDDENVVSVNPNWWKRKINFVRFAYERWVIFLHNRFSRKNLFAVSIANTGTDISKHPLVKEADIIHLHWINQGFLSLNNIRKLIESGKPVVWTMHDMWPVTGICHHARDCDNFMRKCEQCFFIHSKSSGLSNKIFQKKETYIFQNKISLVGCSKWMTSKIQKSTLSKNENILSLPNPIDINIFTQTNKTDARKKLNLPLEKKLILFGALITTDKRKGIDYLFQAINISHSKEIELVVFGQAKAGIDKQLCVKINSMGYLTNNEQIIALYNAVDIFVTASLEENLPNTIMESMACGTPCVGFDTGGIPEMIDHKQNGYVAEYKNAEDLANGIEWVLENTEKLNLSDACVKKVKENYSESVVAEKYLSLYHNLLKDNDQ